MQASWKMTFFWYNRCLKWTLQKTCWIFFRPIWNQKLSNTIFRLSVIDDQGLTSCTYLSQKDLSLSLKAWSHKVGDVKNAIFFIGSRMKSSFSLSKKKKRFIQMTWAFTCALRTFSLLVKAKKGSVSILIQDEERLNGGRMQNKQCVSS